MTARNYAALGEYTAHAQQARDAAVRRLALMHNLGVQLTTRARQPGQPLDLAAARATLDDIAACDRELAAALARANQAAALCGEREIGAESLLPA